MLTARLQCNRRSNLRRPSHAVWMLAAVLWSSTTMAVAASALSDARLRYQRERAQCLEVNASAARAVCLQEAGAALAEARRGGLDTDPSVFEKNARLRCEPLPADDRRDCLARMQGQGTTTGSVTGGGVYRELVTREVGVPAAAPPSASAPASTKSTDQGPVVPAKP